MTRPSLAKKTSVFKAAEKETRAAYKMNGKRVDFQQQHLKPLFRFSPGLDSAIKRGRDHFGLVRMNV